MTKRKTKAEKIASGYRLQNFKIDAQARVAVKDANEFGYLSSQFVLKDLSKTFLYTAIILGLLAFAKMKLG